jgi:predicted anti-sigma-YlaC factor YlaD
VIAEPDVCGNFRALASSELDGEIVELDAARLRRHLRTCAACANWLADVREWRGMLIDDAAGLRRQIPAQAHRQGFRRANTFAGAGASVAAAAVVALALAGSTGSRLAAGRSEQPLSSPSGDAARASIVRPPEESPEVSFWSTLRPQGRFNDL